jgi:hypothetical protein
VKERLGGLLALALGAVLITSGISNSSSGAIGAPPASCGVAVIGVAPTCPTGTININETTSGTVPAPAGGWKVDLSSTCLDTTTGNPVSTTLTIPNNGHITTDPLYIYTDVTSNTQCSYSLDPEAVPDFTPTITSPVTISFDGSRSNSSIDVNFAEAGTSVTTTTTSPVTTAPVTTAPVTTSAVATPSSSSAGNLADTGPKTKIGASLYFGVGLVLLGMVMLFGGTFRRRRGQHS